MTRIFLFSVVLGFFLGYAVRGHAVEAGTSSIEQKRERPFSLAASVSYGPSSLRDQDMADFDVRGNFREALAMANYTSPRWIFTGGLGVFASDLTGTRRPGTNPGGTLALASYSRQLSGEVARIGARYRFTDHLEAGLLADLLFGTDTSFSANLFDSGTSTSWLASSELLYGVGLFGVQVKVGARYFASLGIPGRTLDGVQAVLEAGTPIF
jgi:hypothetical protein